MNSVALGSKRASSPVLKAVERRTIRVTVRTTVQMVNLLRCSDHGAVHSTYRSLDTSGSTVHDSVEYYERRSITWCEGPL
eukprot:11937-Eustigmatos_ZCMA.PRE.1